MVQRKFTSKLGIQADHTMVNSKPLLTTLKPSSLLLQHQDVKKKKMKKSGKTTKYSEFDNFRSPPVRRPPPTLTPVVLPCSPQKVQRSCPVKGSSSSTPNYMKSTSSSDARKEQSQVSSRSPQSVSSKRSNVSKSGHVPARALARTTSLRALTKAPSFKPARASSKKCSQVVLCEDLDVQRATCSSTLKDSKFPCYLELNPGGTESQGTSAMKVCPYTYCSLNGHHHLPLPPLKCFLSARRRAVKAQRSLKIGCLSPRRGKPSTLAGDDSGELEGISSPRGEESMEFAIEIYCKDEVQDNRENRDLFPVRGSSGEEGEDIHAASMAAKESGYESLSEEDHGSVIENVENQPDSEDSDMECEGMVDSALYIDAGIIEETDVDEVYGSDKNGCCYVIQDESSLKADEEEEIGCIIDEIPAENMLQESFDEESMTSGAWLSDDDTQSSISCADESNFCEYVEESTGCNQHNEDEDEISQVSDVQTEEEICRDCSVSQEDDVTAPTEYQESNDSNDFISSENNTEPENSDEGDQNSQLNDCVQEVYNVEEELTVDVNTTQKMAKVINTSENQNEDLDLLNLRRTARNKREIEEEELREFNPRGPNFLPLEPDPEAEKVGLKHQTMDERKNAEEWMVDYALRQAVSKLAPARRKKVALLVEAFETVSPIPKYEPHLRHNSTKLFPPTRSMQACS